MKTEMTDSGTKQSQHRPISVSTQKKIYFSVAAFFTLLAFSLTIVLLVFYKNNGSLKATEADVIEKYDKVAKDHENLVDPDYAAAYFDGNNVYIPSEDIIIEYQG